MAVKEREIPRSIYAANSFCPGCGHGLVLRLIAEVIDEMDMDRDTIGVLAVGCSCLTNRTLAIDLLQSPHGRASAAAAAIKRCRPEKLVLTYQGDGDAASIGIAETIYTAQRKEKITQIVVNNGVYGMTGGQMSPTTLVGQKTTTSVKGRDPEVSGMPLNLMEVLKSFDPAYMARGSIHDAAHINKAKSYIKKAFEAQMAGAGYSCVEILSPCPTNWHMSPEESMRRIGEEVIQYYPLGEFAKGGDQ
jgi:2-oxoglutarate ferredoxin oxidoreductase subunit beta